MKVNLVLEVTVTDPKESTVLNDTIAAIKKVQKEQHVIVETVTVNAKVLTK